MKKGRLIVVSGPSGVGKTTLLKMLLKRHSKEICFSVSYTSRKSRKKEINEKDYYFIPKEEFEQGIKKDIFLEFAVVHDNYYGTSKKEVDNILLTGKDCLLDIDVQGGLTLMSKKKIDATYIFIAPPSFDALKGRLLKRSTDSHKVMEKRLENSKKELEQKEKYDYIIVNDDLKKSYDQLEAICFG